MASALARPVLPPSPGDDPVCVVISHYNAWPQAQLLALLDQLVQRPAGWPFRIRVVVNKALDKPLVLPPRHADVEVLYRENLGYNIGAWDLGWSAGPAFRNYVFLQEECVVLRDGWLAAYVGAMRDPDVGLVGESLVWQRPWHELEATQDRHLSGVFQIDGQPADRFQCYYEFMRRQGVDRGADGSHLQTLVLAARRDVLERIGSFPLGANYGEAVCAEICLSKKVQGMGLKVVQVGWLPFRQVLHPQWRTPLWRRLLQRTVMRWLPTELRRRLLLVVRRLAPWSRPKWQQ